MVCLQKPAFWLLFAVSGRCFINIGSQQCREVRGVQLVVLTGQPCQLAITYRVLMFDVDSYRTGAASPAMSA